jgi:hypothetical protein
MLTKLTFAFIAALVLAQASTAYAQSHRQRGAPHRGATFVPAVPATSSYPSQTQYCNETYKGFRLCDWLRPDRD